MARQNDLDELTLMEQEDKNARRGSLDSRSKGASAVDRPGKADYIAYPVALKQLSARLDATPEEIAAWVWLGPDEGGLAAYRNANELEPPPRFYFDCSMGKDYLAPMMACWFAAEDIARFSPAERFLTGNDLVQRWSTQPGIQVEAFIQAKIAESRLPDNHPTMGGTQWTETDYFPAKESALFSLDYVEAVELEDFGKAATGNHPKPVGHLNHDPEMQARANEIAAEQMVGTKRSVTRGKVANILAKELNMDEATVLRRIRKQWK